VLDSSGKMVSSACDAVAKPVVPIKIAVSISSFRAFICVTVTM